MNVHFGTASFKYPGLGPASKTETCLQCWQVGLECFERCTFQQLISRRTGVLIPLLTLEISWELFWWFKDFSSLWRSSYEIFVTANIVMS